MIRFKDSTSEKRWALDITIASKSVTIEPKKKETKTIGAWDAALTAGAMPLEEFNAKFETKIQEIYRQ